VTPPPVVSVLMPTYRQAGFLARAARSLVEQTYADWELVVVDDGSPDDTRDVLAPFLADPRVRCVRQPRNLGLGAALNRATALARGRYVTYLPSDDVLDPHHLDGLVRTLDADEEVYLAYAGVRWGVDRPAEGRMQAATLQGDDAVGREAGALREPRAAEPFSGNLLALVQVMHRRELEPLVRWPERTEVVSDRIEADHWLALLEHGARFAHTGTVSCEWVDHPDQRHKIIAGVRTLPLSVLGEAGGTGLAGYRRWYDVGRGEWLNWQPSYGFKVDERVRYGRYAVDRDLPERDGLRILVVGELGFNPERLMAFEERGHELTGLWAPLVEQWDTIGPFAYGNVDHIQFGPGWTDAVRDARPDVVYGLLNWQALDAINRVLDADLGIPLVVHFKEGPWFAQQYGLFGQLRRALLESAAQVFISDENRAWYRWALGAPFGDDTTLIADGDLPKADVLGDEWSPRLSDLDGEIHTVCAGRAYGLSSRELAELADAGIHVHLYGMQYYGLPRLHSEWIRDGVASGHLHLHEAVEPHDWVRELSRYDAAWTHIFTSRNGGDLRRATWDDLNIPARLATYSIAGLPWILRDNAHSQVVVERIAREHDVGIRYDDIASLRAQLLDRDMVHARSANMRAMRAQMTFDEHVDRLVALLRQVAGR
jgi:glycosyltransferase involved in cell wall biosynthesis